MTTFSSFIASWAPLTSTVSHSSHSSQSEFPHEHIKELTETFNDLSVLGDNITDEDRVVHFALIVPLGMRVCRNENNCASSIKLLS